MHLATKWRPRVRSKNASRWKKMMRSYVFRAPDYVGSVRITKFENFSLMFHSPPKTSSSLWQVWHAWTEFFDKNLSQLEQTCLLMENHGPISEMISVFHSLNRFGLHSASKSIKRRQNETLSSSRARTDWGSEKQISFLNSDSISSSGTVVCSWIFAGLS